MFRILLLLALGMAMAVPATAQSGATHVDASGAVSGRMPHRMLRPVASHSGCAPTMHIPAGKLNTYGTAPNPDCRRPLQIVSAASKGPVPD